MAERKLQNALRFDLNMPSISKIMTKCIMPEREGREGRGAESATVEYHLHGPPIYLCDFT